MNGMEQFFEQANFADNKKVRYAKLKLRGKAQRFRSEERRVGKECLE